LVVRPTTGLLMNSSSLSVWTWALKCSQPVGQSEFARGAGVAASQELQSAVDLRQRTRQVFVECAGEIHRILDGRPLGGVALVLQEEVDAQPDEADQQRAHKRGAVAEIRPPFGPEFPQAFAERHRPNVPKTRANYWEPISFRLCVRRCLRYAEPQTPPTAGAGAFPATPRWSNVTQCSLQQRFQDAGLHPEVAHGTNWALLHRRRHCER
jgi:hypothetical protein